MKIQHVLKVASTIAVAMATFLTTAPAVAQDYTMGNILLVGYGYCPRSTTEAAGQLLPIATYQALFSLYGITYGGDGQTTFGLPDLRGRVPLGQGQGPGLPSYKQGQAGGVTSATLSVGQMPAHSHGATTTVTVDSTLKGTSGMADSIDPSGRALAMANRDTYLDAAPSVGMKAGSITSQSSATTTIANTGGSQAVSVQNPYLGLRYCVVLEGLYPQRN